MHVDACLGGSSIFSQKHKHLLEGVHRTDSIAFNPHKSLGVPLQCSMFLTKENGILHKCNSADGDYLFQQDKFYDVSYDTGDKSIQCGRKVDVFKFWLMLKGKNFIHYTEYFILYFMLDKFFFYRQHVECLDLSAYLTTAWKGQTIWSNNYQNDPHFAW